MMNGNQRFFFWEERNPQSVIEWGDNAPVHLRIKGNITELTKLCKLINEAITYACEPGSKEGIGEDEIDDQYVLIEAYPDNKRIKPEKLQYNPFETY